MITKEQAKEILGLVDTYFTIVAENQSEFDECFNVSTESAKKERDAWLKLKEFVEGLTEEDL